MQLVSESVCVVVFRRRSRHVEFLLLHRTPERGGFRQSVSGRLESGERAEDVARREVKETGFDPVSGMDLERANVFYNVALEVLQFEPYSE
jgi:8-oxo-dGTP pyrophosphatase MutT (NUDIX family)